MNLDHIIKLAESIPGMPDLRILWLQNMPSASDNTALYYRFFHDLILEYEPLKIVELGTYLGSSAAHLAYSNRGPVVTIDLDPSATEKAKALNLSNLRTITSDSLKALEGVRDVGSFDICFIDTQHYFRQAYAEYVAYRDLVRDGGLIFFDDIELGDEMSVLWDMIPEPKKSLKVLHYTGFGVVQKDVRVRVPPLEDILDEAMSRIGKSS